MLDSIGYQRHRQAARARVKVLTALGQEIGAIPAVAEPARRRACDGEFRLFCETYMADTFNLAWSADHLRVIDRLQATILEGGTFAVAMPRGNGKTSLCMAAVLWAILTGRHRYVMLLAATEQYSDKLLHGLKTMLSSNDLLLADYPEAIWPIRRLEGEARRAAGQRYFGRQTHVEWGMERIILATIPTARCSGAIVEVKGITGNIRGANHVCHDGTIIRPTLALVDDPQTDESARSVVQTAARLSTINGTVRGLAGPGKQMAILVPCTVIAPGDLSDQLLDREKHPEWHGERTRLLNKLPTNEKLWGDYARVRKESLKAGGSGSEATEYYRVNRMEMDAGAEASWSERYNHQTELSAIQHAMNIKLDAGDEAFFAEYQNDPIVAQDALGIILRADDIKAKLNGLARGALPMNASHVVGFIDVQGKMLFWGAMASSDEMDLALLDYGTHPDQKKNFFTLRDARRTLKSVYKNHGEEAAIRQGLLDLIALLAGREFRRPDGAALKIERILVDANWGESTDTVYDACRQTPHSSLVTPSHGVGLTASSRPFADYRRKPGDRIGLHWRQPNLQNRRAIRYVSIDTNWWKSFFHQRLATPIGDPGSLSLFDGSLTAADGMTTDHGLLADHLTSEFGIRTEGRGRSMTEWKLRNKGLDNHWLDCCVGCCVAASMQGCTLPGIGAGEPEKKRRKIVFGSATKRRSDEATKG